MNYTELFKNLPIIQSTSKSHTKLHGDRGITCQLLHSYQDTLKSTKTFVQLFIYGIPLQDLVMQRCPLPGHWGLRSLKPRQVSSWKLASTCCSSNHPNKSQALFSWPVCHCRCRYPPEPSKITVCSAIASRTLELTKMTKIYD